MLYLIQTFRLKDCILHEDDSWDFEFKGNATDKKVNDDLFWELGEAVVKNDKTYLQAKMEIRGALLGCPFEKDEIILRGKLPLPLPLPLTMLKELRDQIMFYRFDTHIVDMLRTGRVYQIDADSSPWLQKQVAQHNFEVTHLKWLQSFYFSQCHW